MLDTLLHSIKRRGVSNAVFIQRRRLLQNRISEITNNDYGKSFVNIIKTGGHTFKVPMSYFFAKIELCDCLNGVDYQVVPSFSF